jgi:hypothetical protein
MSVSPERQPPGQMTDPDSLEPGSGIHFLRAASRNRQAGGSTMIEPWAAKRV